MIDFRNYRCLDLDLGQGMVLIQGGNGQGKSNLLEAIYVLAIAKSPRASSDRELIRRGHTEELHFPRVSAVVQLDTQELRLQIDFKQIPTPVGDVRETSNEIAEVTATENFSVQKYVRVNGVPRRASELVGQINAVMFGAQDMELVHGSPSVRRRYLDILISQSDRKYLRALQRYHRVVSQRNHLLRSVREGKAAADELGFWDDEMVEEGTYLMEQRRLTVQKLCDRAAVFHGQLTGNGEDFQIVYRPSVAIDTTDSRDGIAREIRQALEALQSREIAQGITVSGPHRDDLQLLIENMDAGAYASRGQARTAVLAMKLAEAGYLTDQRRHEPILLLDDVLSELDSARRMHVLEMVSKYQQCFITTTDVEPIDHRFLSRMSRLNVRGGLVEATGGLPTSSNA